MKYYIITYIVCFIITMAILIAAAAQSISECKRMKMNQEKGEAKEMKKRDRTLLIPRMLLLGMILSIPAPVTLAFYVVAFIAAIFTIEE